MATHKEFAEHIGVSRPAVTQMIEAGIIQTEGRGGIDLDQARLDYCAHLRSRAGNKSGNVELDLDLTKERARKAKEEADKLEMQNAVLRGELLERGDVDAAVSGAFARVRARLLSVPSKVAPNVVAMEAPSEIEAAIRRAVNDALRELSETSVTDLCGDNSEVVEGSDATA